MYQKLGEKIVKRNPSDHLTEYLKAQNIDLNAHFEGAIDDKPFQENVTNVASSSAPTSGTNLEVL